jgi:hypothetical protein
MLDNPLWDSSECIPEPVWQNPLFPRKLLEALVPWDEISPNEEDEKDSLFWRLNEETLPYPTELLEALSQLDIKDEELHFIDLDGTILCDRRRYHVDEHLLNLHGDEAYPYIRDRYWSEWDESWFQEFVRRLDPENHLLIHDHFYNPENPNHVILTAWNQEFQTLKIEAGFWENINHIIVNNAQEKPLAILRYVCKLGYIPKRITFIDDRIQNFPWKDIELSKILGNSVTFFRARVTDNSRMVDVIRITERRIMNMLTAANEKKFPERRAMI